MTAPNNPTPELGRYDLVDGNQGYEAAYMYPDATGEWCRHEQAVTTIARLTAERDRCRDRSVVVKIGDTGYYVSQAVADRLNAMDLAERLVATLGAERDTAEKDRDRWHRIAMDAGVITHTDGTTSHPMRQQLADTEASNKLLSERVAVLEGAIDPFAIYMHDGLDNDNNGNPMPDEQGVGWVYLTFGDFRRARDAREGK